MLLSIKLYCFTHGLCCMFLIVVLFVGCINEKKIKTFPESLLREGDLVFRKGEGLVSRSILGVDRNGMYSHIGIVVSDSDKWKVIHAVPGEPDYEGDPDRVKLEEIQEFFGKDKAVAGALMRLAGDSISAVKASSKAMEVYRRRTLFDHAYDLEDTTRMYCTELIRFVYQCAGMDLVGKQMMEINIPGFSGVYIFPSDIAQSEHLMLIYEFTY